MKKSVSIIDYGAGNLFSVSRAFEHCGTEVKLIGTADEILDAERLVLPGVGAFADGIKGLSQIIGAIKWYATTGRPFLGICLGMQMMMDASEEFGEHQGLGLIPGKVVQIPSLSTTSEPIKIPHIGWDSLSLPGWRSSWENTILSTTVPGDYVYFVHSFSVRPVNQEHSLALTYYGGHPIVAAVSSGSLFGCQFHPERSGKIGLNILEAFLNYERPFN